MFTALLLFALGVGVIVVIRRRGEAQTGNIPRPARPAPTQDADQAGTLAQQVKEKAWEKIKDNWQHAFPPLGLLLLFNFLMLASMSEKAGVSGSTYFYNTYLWGLSFWGLCFVIMAIYIDHVTGSKTIKGFKPFKWAIGLMFLGCVWYGVLPGYNNGIPLLDAIATSASASHAGPEPVAQAIESVRRTDGHLSDRFPLSAEVDSLIDAVFANHTDSLRKVMKDIAVAESEGEQFEDGTTDVVKKGDVNERDLGLFQINDSLHGSTCTNSGFDIKELDGNARCAELLLTRRGTTNDWCASAWRWRDGYESKPQYWTCDRTPAQLLAGTDPRGPHGDELLVADAPADSSWSQPVYTYGRETRWSAPPGVDIQILTPDGTIREQLQGQNLPNFPNVRFVRFRVKVGTGAEFSPITVIRSGN